MEQLKGELADEVPEGGEEAGAGVPLLRRLNLSRRTMIMVAAGLLALALVLAGVFAYRASARQKEAVLAQQKERQAKEEAAKAAMLEQVKEGRRAHEAVMAASPPRAELPAPTVPPASEDGAAREPAKESGKETLPAPVEPAGKVATVESPKSGAAPLEDKAVPKKAPEVAAPGAAGGCTLSGGRAEDYGKALGRCLEEFNRLEGRKN